LLILRSKYKRDIPDNRWGGRKKRKERGGEGKKGQHYIASQGLILNCGIPNRRQIEGPRSSVKSKGRGGRREKGKRREEKMGKKKWKRGERGREKEGGESGNAHSFCACNQKVYICFPQSADVVIGKKEEKGIIWKENKRKRGKKGKKGGVLPVPMHHFEYFSGEERGGNCRRKGGEKERGRNGRLIIAVPILHHLFYNQLWLTKRGRGEGGKRSSHYRGRRRKAL